MNKRKRYVVSAKVEVTAGDPQEAVGVAAQILDGGDAEVRRNHVVVGRLISVKEKDRKGILLRL